METAPLEVIVHPNPDGIQQSPPMNQGHFLMEFGDPFGGGLQGFEELFKGFDQQVMPFDMEELFKNFDAESMPFNLEELMEQFQKEMPGFDFSFPDSLAPQDAAPKKKKRKTTRI